MIVGIPKEIKNNEFRVALVPAGAEALVEDGNRVLVETGAGLGTGITDADYKEAGGFIVENDREIYLNADLVVKVKEPMGREFSLIQPGQTIFTYFHFAAREELTRRLAVYEADRAGRVGRLSLPEIRRIRLKRTRLKLSG